MATSYPRRDQASGIWKVSDITSNIKNQGTWPSSGERGIVFGGIDSKPSIEYFTIATTGNAVDFGNLATGSYACAAVGSHVRGVNASGKAPGLVNTMEYVTAASLGNAADFGDRTVSTSYASGCSSATRGCFAGGEPNVDTIDYITIASVGAATDFGNLSATSQGGNQGMMNSTTRGIFAEIGNSGTNVIEFITFSTTGNSIDFGDLSDTGKYAGSVGSSVRGVLVV